jgi:hypothetical protein
LGAGSVGRFDALLQPDPSPGRTGGGGGDGGGSGGGGSGGDGSALRWNHGLISREQTVERFKAAGMEDGAWLLRTYRRKAGWFVLSECFDRNVYHIVIQGPRTPPGDFCIEGGPSFDSLDLLCEFYQSTSHCELPTMLGEPLCVAAATTAA